MPPQELSDPALVEEARAGDAEDNLSVIVRLTDPDVLPPGVRVVSRFGDIATVRVQRGQLEELAESASVAALEAPRKLRPSIEEADPWQTEDDDRESSASPNEDPTERGAYTRRPDGITATGKGVVLAVLDWGCDVAHPAFLNPDGTSRILSLWDQRPEPTEDPGNRWGYGRIFTKAEIDRALHTDDPYRALGYHPADAGGRGGAHGTHVLDIAAGSGGGGGMPGVAPEADLVFVHLARTADVLGTGNLGDSASVLEALDHVFSVAGTRPCVVNMSVGAHGGPHDGSTLVEQGIDQVVALGAGRAVVNSAGNYRTRRAHTMGRVMPGETRSIAIEVPAHDPNESELELYYQRIDRFTAEVFDPARTSLARVGPGKDAPLVVNGTLVGHVHHRVARGTNGDHHIDIMFYPAAPGGRWSLNLTGDTVHDGRYHAWIERDRGLQPTFVASDVVASTTTGTLCNGRLSISCGCIDPHGERPSLATFSSGGPTRDGRVKPEIVAPGVRIRAARSAPRGQAPGARYTRKSGTSMAAPHVAGTIALMQEAAGTPLDVYDIRALLFSSADARAFLDARLPGGDLHRFGYGNLDIVAAERAARSFGEDSAPRERAPETAVETLVSEPPAPHAAAALPNETPNDVAEAEEQTMDKYDESETVDLGHEHAEIPPDGLRSTLADRGWFTDAEELRQVAQQAIGVDPALPLEPVLQWSDPVAGGVRPGDVLRRLTPTAGGVYSGVVVSQQPEPWTSLVARGVPVESARPGLFVEVVEIPLGGGAPQTIGRLLSDDTGIIPAYQTLLRGGTATLPTDQDEDADVAEQFVCTPAQVPDPARKGLHPTVERFRGIARKRNASVGRAQQLLNNFLLGATSPGTNCIDTSSAAVTFITNGLAKLTAKGQNPLVVDCDFGESTELAVKMFQTCAKISRDGVIGPDTWAFLELLGANPRRTLRSRPCCLLAPDTVIDNIVDPSALGTHDTSSEVTGILYCGKAGFVDLGHIREVADQMKFVHDQLTRAAGPPQVIRTTLGLVSIRRTPADALETAAAIAFDEAHGHEIRSWDVLFIGGRNSSFSPEDLVSNFLGTVVGRRAITRMANSGGTFSAAATTELNTLLTSLDVQTESETENAFNLINGRWVDFSSVLSLRNDDYLKRRNFTRAPFFAGHSSDASPPAFLSTPFSATALDDFDYFHIEGGKVLPRQKFDDAIKRVKKEAKAIFGADFDKP